MYVEWKVWAHLLNSHHIITISMKTTTVENHQRYTISIKERTWFEILIKKRETKKLERTQDLKKIINKVVVSGRRVE